MLKNKIHPGQFLREELEERGISQSALPRLIRFVLKRTVSSVRIFN